MSISPVFSQLSSKLTLDDVNLHQKHILLRVDFNVPIENGIILDNNRILSTLPTIHQILSNDIKSLVILSHLGQPNVGFRKEEFTLRPVVDELKKLLPEREIEFLEDCVGQSIIDTVTNTNNGKIFLCENLRFHIEETGEMVDSNKKKVKADKVEVIKFRESLSKLGDVFVFDAFGASHRPHSSIVGINLPTRVCGLLVQKELKFFSHTFTSPSRPFIAILGGAKISDKIMVIEQLLNVCNHLIIGGAMAYTFLKVRDNMQIGKSLFDEAGSHHVEIILASAKEKGITIHLPIDHIIADAFSDSAKIGIATKSIPAGWMGVDIGPQTRALFSSVINTAKCILWNGPVGVFEKPAMASGTLSVLGDCVRACQSGAMVVVGGGDTGAAAEMFYYEGATCASQFTHVSTGGGASLVLLEGKELPGVSALSDRV